MALVAEAPAPDHRPTLSLVNELFTEARREKRKLLDRAYYAANRARLLEKKRAYYCQNREKILSSQKARIDKNPKLQEKRKEQNKIYYEKNRSERIAYVTKWRKQNPEKCKKYQRRTYANRSKHYQEYMRQTRQKYRMEAFEILGGARCKRCGLDDLRVLQIDHVNGGGRGELSRIGGGNALVHQVRREPSKYQVLCANCNWIKRHENGEYVGGITSRIASS